MGNEKKFALDYAILSGNKEMIQLFKSNGGKSNNASSEVLFKSAIEEQQQIQSELRTTTDKHVEVNNVSGAMSEAMSALRERGEKIEKLSHRTASLQSEAADYASNAKALKQNCKKRSLFFGFNS